MGQKGMKCPRQAEMVRAILPFGLQRFFIDSVQLSSFLVICYLDKRRVGQTEIMYDLIVLKSRAVQ